MSSSSMNNNDKTLDIFNVIKRPSATDIVINTIKRLLVTKELKPGDRLPSEMELSQSLGVSRGSIREAMKILSAFGIVSIKRGDGTYISESTNQELFDPLLFRLIISHDDFEELEEFREIMELSVINLAIINAKDEDIEVLKSTYQHMEDKVKSGDYKGEVILESEIMFHTALGIATRNTLIQVIYNFVMELYIPNLYKNDDDENFDKEALDCHKDILNSIINRDLIAGEEAIKNSIRIWKKQYNKKYEI